MLNKKQGFTLIELLVVIAIIGILATIVITALNPARSKGDNATIKADLSGIRSQAELFYDDNSNVYTGLCANTKVQSAIESAKAAAGIGTSQTNTTLATAGSLTTATCHVTADAYAIDVPLKKTGTQTANPMFCVDSNGLTKINTVALLGGITAC